MLRLTVSRQVCLGVKPLHLGPPRHDFYYCRKVVDLLMLCPLSDDRTGLSFTTVGDPRQPSHS
jgi:hypothetical protein